MLRLLVSAAAVLAVAVLPAAPAHAAPMCTQPVQVDCDYCMDPIGNPAPPHPCMFNQPGFSWVNCTLWVSPVCVVG